MKKTLTIFTGLLLLLLAGDGAARAQYTVRINTIAIPPLGPNFDQLFGAAVGGHFMVTLSSAIATGAPPPVRISGTLECLSPTPFTITLSPNFHPAAPIPVTGPAPTILTPAELAEAFGNFIPNNLVAQGLSLNNLLSSGNGLHLVLPEGTYRLCFTAYSYDVSGNLRPVSDPNTGCTTFTLCYKASAPQFVLPVNTMAIPTDIPVINPSYPVQFTWTPSNSTCGALITPLTYTLEMHQIFPGQSAQDALNNPPVFTKTALPSAVFPFDTLLYPNILQLGKQYAIRVRAGANANALANLSSVVFANNGYSTVGAFQYGKSFIEPVAVLVPGTNLTNGGTSPPPNPSVGAANCGLTPPTNTNPISSGTALAGTALTVASFTLTPDNTIRQNSDGTWSGAGTVTWKPFGNPISVYVTYSHIGINTDKTVYSGTISASMDPSTFAGQGFGQWTDFTQQTGSQLDQLASKVQNYVQEAGHLANQIAGGSPVYLPLGLNQTIAGQPASLAILSMSFSAQGATMNVLFDVGVPEAGGSLTLAGMNICISPAGSNFSQGTLLLPVNRSFDIGSGGNNLTITFQGCGNMDSTKGTYATWSGGQLSNVVAHAQISFPQYAIVPDNSGSPGSGPVVGNAVFRFSSWEDWVASVSLPNFEIAGVPGIGIQASTVYFDHSTTQNAPGFAFPDNYPNPDGNAFEGLYVPGMQVLLPSSFRTFNQGSQRTSFGARNLVLDDDGVSADIQGSNIIDISTGDLGGWSFSLDKIEVAVVQNTFQQGAFSGTLRLPVSTTSTLNYSGDLHASNGALAYNFLVQPNQAVTFDIWAAQVTLSPNSLFSIGQDAQGTAIQATLSGGVNIVLSGSPNLSFQAMSFEGLGISNRNQGQTGLSFNPGTWSWGCTTTLSDFPVTINNVTPSVTTSGSNINLGINFDVNVNLGFGDASVVSGTTNLTVFGTVSPGNLSQPPKILKGGGITVDSIYVNGGVGPLNLQGYLAFYQQSGTYGTGFKGHVSADFQILTVQATVQFGYTNNFNYWYVDACVNFPVIPIAPSPFGFSGFGGGAYYNMKIEQTPSLNVTNLQQANDPDDNTAGTTVSGVTYSPSQGSAGISAQLCFATVGTNDAFNGSVMLTGQITNGAFSAISFNGSGYALTNYPSNTAAIATGSIIITYDFANPTFTMSMDYQGHWGPPFNVPVNMYVGSNGWYFKLGDPDGQRVSVQFITVEDPIWQFTASASAYFEMGSLIDPNLPPPQLPNVNVDLGAQQPTLTSIINQKVVKGMQVSLGMMFGADVNASFNFTLGPIYANVTAGVGFDFEIARYDSSSCGATIGWNNWYALGQIYAYLTGSVGISVHVWSVNGNFTLMQLGTGAVFSGGVPNPTWVNGSIWVSASILDGLVSVHQSVSVSVGQQCYGVPPDPLKDVKIISGYGPTGSADVFVYPYISTNISLDQPITLSVPPTKQYPNGSSVTYQFSILSYSITGGGQTLNVTPDYQNSATTVVFKHNTMLLPNTTYTVTVVATVQQLIPDAGDPSASTWGAPVNSNGQPENQNETTTFTFTTGTAPTNIAMQEVNNTYPVNGQRHVLKEEFNRVGYIHVDQWQPNVFTLPQSSTYKYATAIQNVCYFIDLQQHDTVKGNFTTNPGANLVSFQLPGSLKNLATYRVEFWEIRQALPGLTMGTASSTPGPTQTVDSLTRAYGGINVHSANKTISGGTYEAPPLPSQEIFTLYFATSRYNKFADKINSWGNWSGSRNGQMITIQNSMSLNEPFDQAEIRGYTAPDGTPQPPLFNAGINWDHSQQNDNYMDALYNQGMNFVFGYGVSLNYAAPQTREAPGIGFPQPVYSLDWSGFYADPMLTSSEMIPVGQQAATGIKGFTAGSTSSSKSVTGPRTFDPTSNTTLNIPPGQMMATSSGNLFILPKTIQRPGSKSSGSSSLPPITMGSGNSSASNAWQGIEYKTYNFKWNREYYAYEDWVLLEVAGLVGWIEQGEIQRSNATAAEQQATLNQIGGTFRMASNDVGGSVTVPYSQFYNVYARPGGPALLQALKNLSWSPIPGETRTLNLSYSSGSMQSPTVNKTFSFK